MRWATDRLGDDGGIIAFISNNSFIDGNTADGVRKVWAEEFSDIYIVNLRGGVRGKNGDAAKKEGGNVFPIMTGVAVALLVKKPKTQQASMSAQIRYFEVDDYLTAQEKIHLIDKADSINGIGFRDITPNEHGDWINQRDDRFTTYQPLGDKATKGKDDASSIFRQFSRGAETGRDNWVYGFSFQSMLCNVQSMIEEFNDNVEKEVRNLSEERIKWTDTLKSRFVRKDLVQYDSRNARVALYRPFCKTNYYFDEVLTHRQGQLPKIFPTPAHANFALTLTLASGDKGRPLMVDCLPDLHFNGDAQVFPLYTWEKMTADDGGFNLESLTPGAVEVAGYRRRDNITDATLGEYRRVYGDATIEKEDIFYYVYGVLHHSEYRERYEADLKKLLPHIPHCEGFRDYARIGRELARLHLHYEDLPAWEGLDFDEGLAVADPWERYRIGNKKMNWAKKSEIQPDGSKKQVNDYTELRYNDYVTVRNIPEQANDYNVGGRSPLEWVVDRYVVTKDKKSLIVNDPNEWCHEQNNPRYVIDLIGSLVTLSMETQRLIGELPPFTVIE